MICLIATWEPSEASLFETSRSTQRAMLPDPHARGPQSHGRRHGRHNLLNTGRSPCLSRRGTVPVRRFGGPGGPQTHRTQASKQQAGKTNSYTKRTHARVFWRQLDAHAVVPFGGPHTITWDAHNYTTYRTLAQRERYVTQHPRSFAANAIRAVLDPQPIPPPA